MKTTKTKKVNISWLQSNKKMFRIILVVKCLLLIFNYGLNAQNTAYGAAALSSVTTGIQNSAFGFYALNSNTTGHNNTATGTHTLSRNTSGHANTANGYEVLFYNTNGESNTGNGYMSLFLNTTGNSNTADGTNTLYSNTTGSQNTANGAYALYSNGTGSYNTANGYQALYNNTAGVYNAAFGVNALLSTTGSYNAALGYNADVAAGFNNSTAIGYNAKVNASNTIQLGNNAVTKVYAGVDTNATLIAGTLQTNSGEVSTGSKPVLSIKINNQKAGRIDANNAFYGYQSGNARTTGGFNTAMGFQSLYANTTGDGNTAIGREAMKQNNTGNNNTAIGSLALNSNAEGSFNTAIGYNADVDEKLTNATALGHAAWVDESNKIVLGNTGVKTIGGYANWSNLSDARFKKNIQQDVHGLDFITKLNPITYNLDIKKLNSFLGVDERHAKHQQQPSLQQAQAIATKEAIRYTGFLAQEVEQAAQAVNYNFSGVIKPASDKGHYSMSYSDFVVPLVKAVQEQQQMLEAKDAEIKAVKEDLQKVNQQLQQQIDELKKLIVENSSLTKDVATKQVGTSSAEDISLYPNPTTGIFTITASHIDNGVIEIYDMAGNNLQKTTFNNAKSGYQLNVSGYAKGVYLLNIIANNKKYTKRLVIQ